MLDLESTVTQIIERCFPKLQGIAVSCRVVEGAEDFLAGIQWMRSGPLAIILSFSGEDIRQMPEPALLGCIVHELCHAEHDLLLSPSVFAANDEQYAADPNYRSAHEREIDLAVISKGFGRELVALQDYHNQHYEPYIATDGLTREETQALLDGEKNPAADFA